MAAQSGALIVNRHANILHHLSQCANVADVKKTSLKELLEKSKHFPIKFPVYHMMCHSLIKNRKDVTETKLEHFINSTYPLLHEAALHLFINFLEYKKEYGTKIESSLYANMTVIDLVQRLLHKRAVVFFDSCDSYLLLNGKNGIGGWEKIGTNSEKPPLTLEDCLSYDEIKLSALLSVSSHSFFINDGKRDNMGIPCSDQKAFQPDGVIIGLIGARLELPGVMEWEEIVVSKSQNIGVNGYGSCHDGDNKLYKWRRMWSDFYGIENNLPLYEEALAQRDRYKELPDNLFFNDIVFKKRIAISVETLLLEAEVRAAQSNLNAYVRVVGIGLGVWRLSSHQENVFLDSFADCLKKLSPVLPHVSDVHFLWFRKHDCGGVRHGEMIYTREDGSGIKIHFSKESPHSPVKSDDKLLVASYAWDGNALPGNEFWVSLLAASGDPAEACSSQVAELHNPHVNPKRVCGENLHVASSQWGVIHISEYARMKMQETNATCEQIYSQ